MEETPPVRYRIQRDDGACLGWESPLLNRWLKLDSQIIVARNDPRRFSCVAEVVDANIELARKAFGGEWRAVIDD